MLTGQYYLLVTLVTA